MVVGVAALLWLTGWGASLWEVFSDRERLQGILRGAGALAPLPAPALAIVGGYGFGLVEGFF